MAPNEKLEYNVHFLDDDLEVPLIEQAGLMKYWHSLACMCIPVSLLGFVPGNFFSTPCFFMGGFGLLCLHWRFIALKQHINKLIQTPMYVGEQLYSLSATGFTMKGEQFDFNATWSQFTKWSEVGTGLCLFTSPLQFYFVPRRCLPETLFQEVRDLVAANVPASPTCTKSKLLLAVVALFLIAGIGLSGFSIVMTKFGTVK